MTLLSGTLADLDLASIAQVTSLGRTSLRLELRTRSGELIGRLVLKAGRVVSASAGGVHGRDALRVLMTAASDTRFELAREPLDFALSSALGSVADLGALQRAPLGSTRQPAIARPPRAATRPGPTPQAAVRIEMMQGRLDEFDLLTLLQTLGVSRQLLEIEVRDRAGAPAGRISVKAGKVVSARAGDTAGFDAISQLVTSPRSFQFAAFRVVGDIGQVPELASVSEVSLRVAQATAPQRNRVVMEGALSEFGIPALLQTVGCSRQHCALEIHDHRAISGAIFLKAGVVLSARAGLLTGIPAIQHLMSSHPHDRFRLLHLADPAADQVPLGPISHILLELEAPEQMAAPAPDQAPGQTIEQVIQPVRPPRAATASQLVRADGPSPPALVMEGKLSDFDIRTLLETLGATRQHVRLQVFDSEQGQLGEVAVKAGWILSSQVGALGGTDALVVLLGVSKQLRFRVVAAPVVGPAVLQPLGAISELLARLAIDRAPPREPTTRILRWAIPVSFLVGGAIVFVVLRGWSAHLVHEAPVAAMKTQPPADPLPPVEPPAPPPAAMEPPTKPQLPAQQPTDTAPHMEHDDGVAPPSPADATPPPAPRISTSVRTAQAALRRLGYNPGSADNVYGRLTRNAVVQFQRAQHLPVTGVLDQETWSAIVALLAR